MHPTLLSTKLLVPPAGHSQVVRPRLNAILSGTITHALTLVSAPAGYGKTTLVSTWLSQGEIRSTWFSLDEGDNDPIRFLQYFLAALQKVVPAVRFDVLDMLQGGQNAAYTALMGLLINQIADQAGADAAPFVLVLDDFHILQAQPILDLLTYLLDHMPPMMHMILLTRTDPPLPVARLRARSQVVEIRAEQLRFTTDEISAFMNQRMGLEMAEGDVAAIEARTEGWIAGLQLAVLSMLGCKDIHHFISAFTGSHSYIMDYLVEEVLRLQPETVRSFLLGTSILERMCGPLCQAVIYPDNADALAGQAMLEYLEQNHLFVIALDPERRWYRYHQLFKDVLNRRLEISYPGQIADLHRRASGWFGQNSLIEEAIQHALAAGDQQAAANMVEQHGCSLLMRGETSTLAQWLEKIEPYVQTRPWLAMQKGWVLVLTGHLERAEQIITTGENLVSGMDPASQVKIMQGSFAAARAQMAIQQADAPHAADLAQHALGFLPEISDFSCSLRSVSTSILGDASWIEGKLDEAGQAYTQAVRIGQAAENPHMTMIANTSLAEVLAEQGKLHQASGLYAKTLQVARKADGLNSPFTKMTYFGMAGIYYELNRLAEASEALEHCLQLCRQWGDGSLQAGCMVLTARIALAQGDWPGVEDAIRSAEQLLDECQPSPRWFILVKAAIARLWLALGNPDLARLALRECDIHPEISPAHENGPKIDIPYLQVPAALARLRLDLAQGKDEAALAAANRLLIHAESSHHTGRVIEVLVLKALALQGSGMKTQALEVLEHAIQLAQPEGYRRVFLDEGPALARLLNQAKTQSASGIFATDLLAVILQETQSAKPPVERARTKWAAAETSPGGEPLVEPLSVRELEVLQLIEAGCSNPDIAARLVISEKTVKRHISNIYAKLGVKSRTQAVSFARAIRLLE